MARIHLQRAGAYGYLQPQTNGRFTLHAADGSLRCDLSGPAGEARREARRIIDHNPKCFPNRKAS